MPSVGDVSGQLDRILNFFHRADAKAAFASATALSMLALMASGVLDPTPLVSHHMALEEAPEAYAAFDRREALKIVLSP